MKRYLLGPLAVWFLSSCSSSNNVKPEERVVDAVPQKAQAVAPVQVPEPIPEQDVPQATVDQVAEPSHDTHADASAHGHHVAKKSVDPMVALGWLKNGNTRFVKSHLRKDGQSVHDRERLSKGQQPHTIVLSCSDSRVPPELVFDQKLGEIFVIRTAGEVLDFGAIASMEYAIEHLGSRLVLVMGHTSCGAVKAALESKPGVSVGSASLDALVADITPRISSVASQSSPNVALQSETNAKGVAQDLIKRSAIIGAKVSSGEVKIVPALYHLDSGAVDFL